MPKQTRRTAANDGTSQAPGSQSLEALRDRVYRQTRGPGGRTFREIRLFEAT
jgi:hypothetical protein